MNRRQLQAASEQARRHAVELGEAGDARAVGDKPANFRALLDAFLVAPTNDNMRAFTNCITEFRDWGIGKDYSVPLTRYQHDHEQWWYLHRPYIAEW